MSRTESGGQAGQGTAANLKDKATEVASNIRDMGSNAYEAATQKYDDLKETATEYYQAGREKAQQWESQIESYVRDQPIKSLLMAAGVGIIVGAIWKRL